MKCKFCGGSYESHHSLHHPFAPELADEDAEILERAGRIAQVDPMYLARVRDTLTRWRMKP